MNRKILVVATIVLLLFCCPISVIGQEDSIKETFKPITIVDTSPERAEEQAEKQITDSAKDGHPWEIISYNVISQKPVTEEKTVAREIVYENLTEKNAPFEEEYVVMENGEEIPLFLKDVTYEDRFTKNRTKKITAYTDYGKQTKEPTVPKEKTMDYYDSATKKEITVTLPLKEVSLKDEWSWLDDVVIPIKVIAYDSDYYQFGDVLIPYNEEKIELSGKQEDLLKSLGLDTEQYRIESFRWDGDVYTENGVQYRNAVASGSRYVATYRAYYEDAVSLPDAPGYVATGYYEGVQEVVTNQTEYVFEPTVLYEKEKQPLTVRQIIAIISAGSLLIALFIIGLLFLLKKKRKEGQKNDCVLWNTRE